MVSIVKGFTRWSQPSETLLVHDR